MEYLSLAQETKRKRLWAKVKGEEKSPEQERLEAIARREGISRSLNDQRTRALQEGDNREYARLNLALGVDYIENQLSHEHGLADLMTSKK